MNKTIGRNLTMMSAALLLCAACDMGDEYTDDGQLVEKTDVRVKGVDFGRGVDAQRQLTDETDTFGPNDTVYASVRTKGSSPHTVLGVKWMDETGREITGGNTVIKPTGDTATVFSSPWLTKLKPGRYTLDMRVNGKVVKTAHFTVTDEPSAPRSARPVAGPSRSVAVRSWFRNTYARLANATRDLVEGAPKNQSPFAWRSLRGGMNFSKLDRISNPATRWKCTPFFLSAVGLERDIALEHRDFTAGHVTAMVDTVDRRVFNISYHQAWIPRDSAPRIAFEREMYDLALEWDKIPGVIRHPPEPQVGPYSATWQTADSTWSARMSYMMGAHDVTGRPQGFEIEEIGWGERLTGELTDSVKGLMHNPESEYYRTPNRGCEVLLSSKAE